MHAVLVTGADSYIIINSMNVSKILHPLSAVFRIKSWYYLIAALISLTVCILALRSNNQHMATLRQDVYSTDQQAGDVATALQHLQAYVTTHMNTKLTTDNGSVYPPIQLKYTYERLVKARSDRLTSQNTQIYSDAQKQCEQAIPTGFSGRGRVGCIEDYVQKQTPVSQGPAVPDALYKFSFVSPAWSPDLAGWTIVSTALLFVLTVISFFVNRHRKSRV
ncbi:MAG: hypothetical protein JWM81_571 [Candidatus Saccharibacteria bacterium]|nr:hypothetical protein [Candidatus Saccharibacteria bacterium]